MKGRDSLGSADTMLDRPCWGNWGCILVAVGSTGKFWMGSSFFKDCWLLCGEETKGAGVKAGREISWEAARLEVLMVHIESGVHASSSHGSPLSRMSGTRMLQKPLHDEQHGNEWNRTKERNKLFTVKMKLNLVKYLH